MANMFDENGNYNKTEWKPGDRITAGKLNKIEESLEAINNNDIERHKEADERLDALEEQNEAVEERFDELEDLVADNKTEVEVLIYENNVKMDRLEQEMKAQVTEAEDIVDQGKADMEAMVAEVEADLEGLHAKDEELSEQLAHIENNLPFINVNDRGIFGDNETNVTEKLQALIDSLEKGGELYFPIGRYIFEGGITIHKNIIIRGENLNTMFILKTGDCLIISQSTQYNKNTIKNLTLSNMNSNIGVGIKIKTDYLKDGEWGACTNIDNVTIYGFDTSIMLVQSWLCTIKNVTTQDGNKSFSLLLTDGDGRNTDYETFCNGNYFLNCSSKNKIGFVLHGARYNTFENIGIEFADIGVQHYKDPNNKYLNNVSNVFKNIWFEIISKYVVCNFATNTSYDVTENTKDDLNTCKFENCFGVKELLPENHIPELNENYELIKICYDNTYTPILKDFITTKSLGELSKMENETPLMLMGAYDPSTQSRNKLKQILNVSNKGVVSPLSFNSISKEVKTDTTTTTENTVTALINYSEEIAKRVNGNPNSINKIATVGIMTISFYLTYGFKVEVCYFLNDSIYGKYVGLVPVEIFKIDTHNKLTDLTITQETSSSLLGNKTINISATGKGIQAMRVNINYLSNGAMTEITD